MVNLVRSKAKQQGIARSKPAGRLLKHAGDGMQRWMVIVNRTRLIDPSFLS